MSLGASDELLLEHFSDTRVYGREKELAVLEDALNRISRPDAKSEVVLVVGSAGTGKSTLVRELAKRCAPDVGGGGVSSFAEGKFDQLASREPYAAIVDAFAELCRSGDVDPRGMSSPIDNESRKLLLKLIPDSRAVFGDEYDRDNFSVHGEGNAPCSSGNTATEAQNRLKHALRLFVRAISSAEHPIVLFLDDMQWADESSVDIITNLVTDSESRNVLYIVAFRDDDISSKPPLSRAINDIEKSQHVTVATRIQVGVLDRESINSLLSDVLSLDPSETLALTEVVHRKTLGNVFFVIQFMIRIQEEGILSYSFETFRWEWDVETIQAYTDIADNVVHIVAGRIERLPRAAQVLLKIASCLGSTFHHHVLAATRGAWEDRKDKAPADEACEVATTVEEEVVAVLGAALREGLLEQVSPTQYKFAHDRIQQAAYSLIPEGQERQVLHYRLGKVLWEMSTLPDRQEWMSFLAADQLNRGAKCIHDTAERFAVAELNLEVAEEAMSTGAFISAAVYLESGIDILDPQNKWVQNYELTLRLCSAAAEAEYCGANFDRSIGMVHEVLANAESFGDKLRVYFTLVGCQSAAGKYDDALKTGFEVLAKLGEQFPQKPQIVLLVHGFFKTKRMLKGKTNDDLLGLPRMQDENKIAAMRIMSSLWLTCVVSQSREYLLLLTFRMVQLSLRCGISDFSAFGFAVYGMLLCGAFNSLKGGYRFGPLALELLDKSKEAKEWSPRVNLIAYCGVKHFRTPLHECPAPFVKSYNVAMSTGDIEFALLSALHYCMFYYFSGMPLAPLEKDIRAYCNQMREYKQETPLLAGLPYHQCVLNLMGLSDNTVILSGEAMDLEEVRMKALELKNMQAVTVIMLLRMQLAYYFGETKLAKELLTESQSLKDAFMGTHWGVVQTYFEGLVALSIARDTKKGIGRRALLRLARKSKRKMKKLAKGAACNSLHMYLLLEAECSSLLESKKSLEDMRKMYDSAINAAGKAGFLQDKALSSELAGKYLLSKGDKSWASHYLTRAHETYIVWGAEAKAKQLQSDHLTLIRQNKKRSRKSIMGLKSRRQFSLMPANSHRRSMHLEIKR